LAALSSAFEAFEKPGLIVNYEVSNVEIFKGALLGINGSGYLIPLDHGTASLKFAGVAAESIDNSDGSAGDENVNVLKSGSFVFKAASGFTPAITDLGKEVYANSDWEVQVATAGLTNTYKVGTITALETTSTGQIGVRVRIDNYSV
jgi:hypothetical protein